MKYIKYENMEYLKKWKGIQAQCRQGFDLEKTASLFLDLNKTNQHRPVFTPRSPYN